MRIMIKQSSQRGGLSVKCVLRGHAVIGWTQSNDTGQGVCAHVSVSPSSISWYQCKEGSNSRSCNALDPCPAPWDLSIAGWLKGLQTGNDRFPYITDGILELYFFSQSNFGVNINVC